MNALVQRKVTHDKHPETKCMTLDLKCCSHVELARLEAQHRAEAGDAITD